MVPFEVGEPPWLQDAKGIMRAIKVGPPWSPGAAVIALYLSVILPLSAELARTECERCPVRKDSSCRNWGPVLPHRTMLPAQAFGGGESKPSATVSLTPQMNRRIQMIHV